jgi:ribosomal-protein-alanine N-acetyltransferase
MLVRSAQPGDERAIYDMVLYARRRVLRVKWSELAAALIETVGEPPNLAPLAGMQVDLLCGEADGRLGGFWASSVGPGQIAHLNALILHDRWSSSETTTAFLSGVKQTLRDSGRTQIAYVGIESWLTTALAESAFTHAESVITLQKQDGSVPDRGNTEIRVLPAQASHLVDALALDERAFPPLWRTDEHTLTQQLSDSPFFVIAEWKEQIVGYAYVSLVGRHGHLTRLVVDPSMQGERIGIRLLAECVAFFSDQGVYGITLNAQETNTHALRLYQWFGFALLGHEAEVWVYTLGQD